MNLRARVKNAAKWACVGGAAGAVIGGGIATVVYYTHNDPEQIYAKAIKDISASYGCDYDDATSGLRVRPSCRVPSASGTCIINYHDICKEGEIIVAADKIYRPYADINEKNTLQFAAKFAVPIGFAAGSAVGFLLGFCKSPSASVSRNGFFSPGVVSDSKEELLSGIQLETSSPQLTA